MPRSVVLYDRLQTPEFAAYVNERLDEIQKERLRDIVRDEHGKRIVGRPEPNELAFWVASELGRPYERTQVHRILQGKATVLSLKPVLEAWIRALGLNREKAFFFALRPALPTEMTLEQFSRAFESSDEPNSEQMIDLTDEPKVYAVN